MTIKNIIKGGIAAGLIFYGISVIIWALFKFLPIVPLSIAIPAQGLGQGWLVEHLAVSLLIGLVWAIGYAIYGVKRQGGWLYGAVIYLTGSLPTFIVYLVISAPLRSMIFYGAIISLVGALLGGKVIALMFSRH